MTRRWQRTARVLIALLALAGGALLSVSANAQDAAVLEKQELAELLAAAQGYRVHLPQAKADAALRELALLNFTNPERNQERGSVFVWLYESRPVAVGQFFRFDNRKGRLTKHAFHSLSESPLEVRFEDVMRWSPNEAGVKWQDVPDAPVPAEDHSRRMLQMRQLARRYRLTLTGKQDEKTELRLISRPLFEYEPASAGVRSGAIFSFVVATDPEALLLLEACAAGNVTRYRCGFARFHFLPITAMDGDREVWHVDADPSLAVNQPGNPATMRKIYNSYYHETGLAQ